MVVRPIIAASGLRFGQDVTFDYPTLGVPEPAEIYVPYKISESYTLRSGGYSNVRRVRVLARIRAEAAPGQVNADLENAASHLLRAYPALYRGPKGEPAGFPIHAQPLREAIVGNSGPCCGFCSAAQESC